VCICAHFFFVERCNQCVVLLQGSALEKHTNWRGSHPTVCPPFALQICETLRSVMLSCFRFTWTCLVWHAASPFL
jgi:hypothetical protein